MLQVVSSIHDKPHYYLGGGVPAPLVRYYFSKLGLVRRVLDLGCGIGDIGRYGPPAPTRVYGADIDLGALRQAVSAEAAVAWNGERGGLPFADASFDAVIAKDILEHVQRPWELVAEIRRVLRPSGQAIISVPMAKPHVVWEDYTHIRGFTRRAIVSLLRDGGFEVTDLWRMGPVPLSMRLNLVWAVPRLLAVPMADYLWGSSWELLVRAPSPRPTVARQDAARQPLATP